MKISMVQSVSIGLALSLLFPFTAIAKDPVTQAKAIIVDCAKPDVVLGGAELNETKSDQGVKLVSVVLKVQDLPPGPHGVHIHETGSCTPCGSAGGHFDPGPFGESNPDANHPFHLGDLTNIKVDSKGNGKLQTQTTRVTLSAGPISILDDDGSAFIVHVNEDSFCPKGKESGCAGGGRIACGIITAK